MPTIILIFYLLTTPADKLICSMWTNNVPTSADVAAACGQVDLEPLKLDVVNIHTGVSACQVGAGEIYRVREACPIQGRLDNYRLDIIRPDFTELLCSVSTLYASPTPEEIGAQCGKSALARYQAGNAELRYVSKKEISPETSPKPNFAPPPLNYGSGLLEMPNNAAELASNKKYYLLAGKLLWFGYAKPSLCPGGLSGVDFRTGAATECGMESAAGALYAWQNRLDESIYSASLAYNVPPRLLKKLIAEETQFWVWTGTDGEVGLIQITDQGADLVLRYTLPGYYQLSNEQRQAERVRWMNALRCDYCDVESTMRHAEQAMPLYAQALAAYYSQHGSWQAAMVAWNEKHTRILGG